VGTSDQPMSVVTIKKPASVVTSDQISAQVEVSTELTITKEPLFSQMIGGLKQQFTSRNETTNSLI